MNIIQNKKPVNIEIKIDRTTETPYAFYTPAFFVESDTTDRYVNVTSLKGVLDSGFDEDSNAYNYVKLALLQDQHVDNIIIVSKRTNESYLDAYIASPKHLYYFMSLENQSVKDVLEISDYLINTDTRKLIFITKYEDISLDLIGRRNIVWWWQSDYWFWDSSAIVGWDSDSEMELSVRQFPESAWISRCGSIFPSQVQWSCKELKDIETISKFTPQKGVSYDDETDIQPPFNTPSNYYDSVEDYGVTWGSGTTCNGEWIDNVVFDDWLCWAIQRNVWKLFKTSKKISATEDGVNKIHVKVKEVLDFGIEQDGILSYKITKTEYNRYTRTASLDFEYTRVHAIIGVITIKGTLIF